MVPRLSTIVLVGIMFRAKKRPLCNTEEAIPLKRSRILSTE
ncbi:hypothetical protein EYZ11_010487 [Aspergillus tanneri]|uniref:Uncharacterized protein n=1 Tax=Aspergillus tanneri TaxID=1220188 RepID=A0A4S3J7D9_9EURO|nr:hypothetical protein EYZ11_010487 [Aspergillus tanneri]